LNTQVRRYITTFCSSVAAVVGILSASAAASADILAPSYIPTIDIYPQATFVTGEDAFGAPGGKPFVNGDIQFNGVFSEPLLKHLAFQYEHDRGSGINNTIGNIGQQLSPTLITPGLPAKNNNQIIGGSSNDIINEFRVAYSQPEIGIVAGYYYRYRFCCPNTADPTNLEPADWHATYLQLGLTTPAIKALNGTTLGVTGRGTYNLHHTSVPFQEFEAANGLLDKNGKPQFGVNYGANINVPINSGLSLFGSWSFGAFDFFDNAAHIFYYDISDFGLNKKINKYLSFSADVNNLVQQHLENDVPFTYPNTIHRIYLSTGLDIHLAP
jgi:hypothetical protein